MDRLDFAVHQCYGRRQEVGTLRAAYDRVRDSSEACRSEVVLIGGASGTGKSTLAQTLREPVSKDGGYFISGKFDERRSEPYSAFISAFSEFFETVAAKGVPETDRMKESIVNSIGSEVLVLADVVPSLERIIGKHTREKRRSSLLMTIVEKEEAAERQGSNATEQQEILRKPGQSADRSSISHASVMKRGMSMRRRSATERKRTLAMRRSFTGEHQETVEKPMTPRRRGSTIETAKRFNFAFRTFIRAISSPQRVTVLFLDDLQWGDVPSLDLMLSLVSDVDSKHVLFVLAYVNNEAEGDNLPRTTLEEIETTGVTTTKIKVSNLERDAVSDLISDKLDLSPESTESLTTIVYQKTQGNALFVVQYLKFLVETDCLFFDANGARWRWDMELIQSKDTSSSDNITNLTMEKIRSLPKRSQNALMIASCIGADVDERLLNVALFSEETMSDDRECNETKEILARAVQEGLLSIAEHGSYRFAHNRIQHAAYSLIPRKERESFHLLLARSLWKRASAEDLEEWLFIIVNQITRGVRSIDKEDKVEAARLYLGAGEKAMLSSAFAPATTYLGAGVDLLEEGDWKQNYNLCYDLYHTAAEAEYCNGNVENVDRYLKQSFLHVSEFRDRIPLILIHMMSLGAQGQVQVAANIGFDVLSELGEHFPSRHSTVRLRMEMYKTMRKLRRKSNSSLLRLPMMENADKLAAMQVLNLLGMYSLIGRPKTAPFVFLRMVQLSLEYGLCGVSSYGFAGYGIFVCAFGDVDGGYRCGQVALSLLEKLGAKELVARVYSTVYSIIEPWRQHVKASLQPLNYGCRVGLETGDIERSMANSYFFCFRFFQCGQPLPEVDEVTRKACENMAQYQQHTILRLTLPIRQFVLNLMGRSDDPLILTGEAMDQEEMLKNATNRKSGMTISYFRMILALFWDDLDLAAKMAQKSRRSDPVSSAAFDDCTHSFYDGLTALSLARKSKRRECMVNSRMSLKRIKLWARHAPQNCLHRLHLLKAEFAALKGKREKALTLFGQSIEQAGKEGFTHEQALAFERAGMYQLENCNPSKAAELIKRSLALYSQWGAKAKVAQLEAKYRFLL